MKTNTDGLLCHTTHPAVLGLIEDLWGDGHFVAPLGLGILIHVFLGVLLARVCDVDGGEGNVLALQNHHRALLVLLHLTHRADY